MRLIEQFLKDHKIMARVVKSFERELDRLETANNEDYRVIELALEFIIDYPDVIHHPNEEVMFTKLERLNTELDKSIAELQDQHESMAKATQALKKQVDGLNEASTKKKKEKFIKAARDFVAQQYAHMRKEESDVFPKAQGLLNQEDWRAINYAIHSVEDEEVSDRLEIAFDELCRIIEHMSASPHNGTGVTHS